MPFAGVRPISLALTGLLVFFATLAAGQVPSIVGDYWDWRNHVGQFPEGVDPIDRYRAKLLEEGYSLSESEALIETLRQGLVIEEGEFYDEIYETSKQVPLRPNALLVEAVADRKPGRALDCGMGQGRNALYLAKQGWDVTGFDPSREGLRQANEAASAHGIAIETVVSGAEYFDFGLEKWDLVAIIYPIEKHSVYQAREALRPGGLVVIEAPHVETAPYPYHYATNELLDIFRGFRVLKYEDTKAVADWDRKETRLVRLIAEKPK